MCTAVLSVLALQWKFSERRKKKSRLINQSVCARVMCATPPHVASISALYSVPPLLYPLQKLVTTEDVFVVQNKSFHIEIYIRFVLTFFFFHYDSEYVTAKNPVLRSGSPYKQV